jgi:hypothetical protein
VARIVQRSLCASVARAKRSPRGCLHTRVIEPVAELARGQGMQILVLGDVIVPGLQRPALSESNTSSGVLPDPSDRADRS